MAVWTRAAGASPPRATAFGSTQPDEGEQASFPIDVRVLYDDQALYIGASMTQPGGVVAPLARRDQLLDANGNNGSFNSLTTDKLIIRLDPYHNHLDDAWFEVNPAGVKGDQFNGDPSWDPIWEAATQVDSLGWTAEMRIPFSQLRFSRDPEQTWGMQIWRYLDQLNEQDMWSFRRRNEPSGPAFFGHLTGLAISSQPRQLEVMPYVVTGSRFEHAAPADPYHDGRDMRFSAGADVKYLLTSNLTLDATLNPDFGQVEVDPAVLNLSAFETYYDEKRPFFIAGASAFRFGGMRCMFCSNSSGLSAFYSRRIGRPPQLDRLRRRHLLLRRRAGQHRHPRGGQDHRPDPERIHRRGVERGHGQGASPLHRRHRPVGRHAGRGAPHQLLRGASEEGVPRWGHHLRRDPHLHHSPAGRRGGERPSYGATPRSAVSTGTIPGTSGSTRGWAAPWCRTCPGRRPPSPAPRGRAHTTSSGLTGP